jgi:hypothetical protein
VGRAEDYAIEPIDLLDEKFHSQQFSYSVCSIRFSIGDILFRRNVWDEMGKFSVNRKTNAMGQDEVELCNLAMSKSKSIIISENTLVGHLSFGG